MNPTPKSIGNWVGQGILPGESKDIALAVSESYSGMTVKIPTHVRRTNYPLVRGDLDNPEVKAIAPS